MLTCRSVSTINQVTYPKSYNNNNIYTCIFVSSVYLILPDVSMLTVTRFCKHSEFPKTTGYVINYDVMEVGVTSKRCQAAFLVDDKEHHEFIGYI